MVIKFASADYSEGANILTRSIDYLWPRCYTLSTLVLQEIEAAAEQDPKKALRDFDKAIMGHIGFIISNNVRALFWV